MKMVSLSVIAAVLQIATSVAHADYEIRECGTYRPKHLSCPAPIIKKVGEDRIQIQYRSQFCDTVTLTTNDGVSNTKFFRSKNKNFDIIYTRQLNEDSNLKLKFEGPNRESRFCIRDLNPVKPVKPVNPETPCLRLAGDPRTNAKYACGGDIYVRQSPAGQSLHLTEMDPSLCRKITFHDRRSGKLVKQYDVGEQGANTHYSISGRFMDHMLSQSGVFEIRAHYHGNRTQRICISEDGKDLELKGINETHRPTSKVVRSK